MEELFVREFKDTVRLVGNKDIFSVPLPDACKTWEVSGTEEYKVMGVEDQYYKALNDSVVRKLPKGYVAKRRIIDKVTRTYKKGEDGKYLYDDYQVPGGSTVITSGMNINLPYSRYVKDESGFGYVDFFKRKGNLEYMYVLPRENLYRVNQTALAISVKNMKNFQGMGYLTWDNGVIYIHVIPYNPNSSYIGSKILKTGTTLNYTKEIHAISDYWESIGFIPNIKLSALQDETNLVLKPTVTGYDAYEPIDFNPVSEKEVYGEDEES